MKEALALAGADTRQNPGYAARWALLAKASDRVARAGRTRSGEWIASSRAAAERTAALDPGQAKAWTLLGRIRFFVGWDIA